MLSAAPSATTFPSTTKGKRDCPITVSVRLRPPANPESLQPQCVTQVEDRSQVLVHLDASASESPLSSTPSRAFTFDHVFGIAASQDEVYESCVQPLLEPFVQGYNATILAYGQTGSGKTFTMGTCPNHDVPNDRRGIAPRLVEELLSMLPDMNQRLIRVSYIELYQEEVRDLIDPEPTQDVVIREDRHGNIVMQGVSQIACQSKEDILGLLERGSQVRTVGETNMNNASSRSHAIFSIILEQYLMNKDKVIECRVSKLHLVDLAGSERQKRTGADGVRFKESIKINSGLLALGNVINALSAPNQRGEPPGHVPYRDSKLTRLLQDSLGGNSKTVLIACVSPKLGNAQESLNTLTYATRCKHIKNRPVINLFAQPPPPSAPAAPIEITPAQIPLPPSPSRGPTPARLTSSASTTSSSLSAAELIELVDQLKAGLTQANSLVADLTRHSSSTAADAPTPASLVSIIADYLAHRDDPHHLARLAAAAGLPPPPLPSPSSDALPPVPNLPAQAPPVFGDALRDRRRSATAASDTPVPPPSRLAPPSSAAPGGGGGKRSGGRARTAPPVPAPTTATSDDAWTVRRLENQLADQAATIEKLTVQLQSATTAAETKAHTAQTASARAKEAEDEAAYLRAKLAEAEADARKQQALRRAQSARRRRTSGGLEGGVEENGGGGEDGGDEILSPTVTKWRTAAERAMAEVESLRAQLAVARPATCEMAVQAAESSHAAAEQPAREVEEEMVRLTNEMEAKLNLIQELDASRQRTDSLSQKFRDKMVKLERELAGAEKQVDRLRSEKMDLDSEKNRLRHEYEGKIQEISAQLAALRGRQKQHDKLLREKESKERQIQDLQSEVEKLRDRHSQLKLRVRAETDRLASAEAVHQASLRQLQKQHDDDVRKIRTLETQLASLRKRLDASANGRVDSAASVGAAEVQQQQQAKAIEEAQRAMASEWEEIRSALEEQLFTMQRERDAFAAQVKDLDHYRATNRELKHRLRELMAASHQHSPRAAAAEPAPAPVVRVVHAARHMLQPVTPSKQQVLRTRSGAPSRADGAGDGFAVVPRDEMGDAQAAVV
ncbi:hypothetical protein H9P43_009630 [Blastocladiella emersonii ATCC 22665]|nr:hypothetical protein H9P43_009630 [Blastocladiella emersonii ATCC 22665]